jgi:hypothetical protein
MARRTRIGIALLLAASALGCEADGPQMLPGEDCIACHTHAAGQPHALSVAGTVFEDATGKAAVTGASIEITDADGGVVTLTSNAAGNFFSTQPVPLPLQAAAVVRNGQRLEMPPGNGLTGSCNACHSPSGAAHGALFGPR